MARRSAAFKVDEHRRALCYAPVSSTPWHDEARAAFAAGLASAAPAPAVTRALAELPASLAARPRWVLAVGKAAYGMAQGAAALGWERALLVGPVPADVPWPRVCLAPGAHPHIDKRSVAAAALARELVCEAPPHGLVLALISGGTSAMLAEPVFGVTLEEKAALVAEVMARGAPIAALNARRRELSAIKGGKLVAAARAPVLTLLMSDVAGDDARTIGSGPTISAPALPWQGADDEGLARALRSEDARGADRFRVLAGQDAVARGAAQALAARRPVRFIESPVEGAVEDAAARLAAEILGAAPGSAVVAFGEPTVRLGAEPGRGGRAQHLALLLARHLAGSSAVALVAGTDGVDGPSQPAVAGALVDGATWRQMTEAAARPELALARWDARRALEAVGALVVTGPTGVNHADVMILLANDSGA